MNGKVLYSYKRDYGEYVGSFMRLTITGFSSLYAVGVTLSNRPFSRESPFFCEFKSSSYIDIYAR